MKEEKLLRLPEMPHAYEYRGGSVEVITNLISQQKMAFSPSAGSSMSPNAANLQGYGAGPGMGPPAGMHHSSMGPPSLHSGVGAMGPPSSAPAVAPPAVAVSNPSPLPNSHHDGPMPPPATAANSHPSLADAPDSAHDNGHAASTTTGKTTVRRFPPVDPPI